jgi:hypothetical protein
MPTEVARLHHRIGDRDRRFFAALALLAAAGTIVAVLLFGRGGGAPGSTPNSTQCIAFDQPGAMGGGTWHFCGVHATAFCRVHASESVQVTATCARLDP